MHCNEVDEQLSESPIRLRRMRIAPLFFCLVMAPIAILACLFQLKSPYARYVSPPLDWHGTRIALLVPREWSPHLSTVDFTGATIRFRPPEPMTWLPSWARGWMQIRSEDAEIAVYWIPEGKGYLIHCTESPNSGSRSKNISDKGICIVTYWRSNPQAYQTTSKDVFNSIQVK